MRCSFPEERWYDLGLRLRVDKTKLDTIEACYRHSSRCLTECLSVWLQGTDYVVNRGGATVDLLSDALRSMNEIAVADKLDQEKSEPVYISVSTACILFISIGCSTLAISIFDDHHPLLSESLSDPLDVAVMLNKEDVITYLALTSIKSVGPSVPKQREVLLAAVRAAIHSNFIFLQTFASVLCKFTDNVQLGEAILTDYGE